MPLKFKTPVDLRHNRDALEIRFDTPWDMHKTLWTNAVDKYAQKYDGDYDPERVWMLYATVCQVFDVAPWTYDRLELEGIV